MLIVLFLCTKTIAKLDSIKGTAFLEISRKRTHKVHASYYSQPEREKKRRERSTLESQGNVAIVVVGATTSVNINDKHPMSSLQFGVIP